MCVSIIYVTAEKSEHTIKKRRNGKPRSVFLLSSMSCFLCSMSCFVPPISCFLDIGQIAFAFSERPVFLCRPDLGIDFSHGLSLLGEIWRRSILQGFHDTSPQFAAQVCHVGLYKRGRKCATGAHATLLSVNIDLDFSTIVRFLWDAPAWIFVPSRSRRSK